MNRILFTALAILLAMSTTFSQVSIQKQSVTISNNENVNSVDLDFSPAFYQDGVVFVSSRNEDRPTDKNIHEHFFDLYYADLSTDGIPGPPQPLSVQINSKYHEGPVTFNKTGDKIYFTRSNLNKNNKVIHDSKGVVRMKIYEADKSDSEWTNIRELPFNNTEYSCIHPTIDVTDHRLYFASDMPGGHGGMDIYYSDLVDGKWSKPVNMGTKVNSPDNEVFPFIHPSGVLYFSSDRAGGYGGFDFYRYMPDPKIPFALILSEPYNTPSDDIGLIINNEGTKGFFTSARGGGVGKDDLYAFNDPDGVEGIEPPVKFLPTNFLVYDLVTQDPIKDAGIILLGADEKEELLSLYDVSVVKRKSDELMLGLKLSQRGLDRTPDLTTNTNGITATTLASNRKFYALVKREGYEPNEVIFTTYDEQEGQVVKIAMNPIPEVEEPVVVVEKGVTLIMDKIFYDFDKSYIRAGAARDLDALVALMKKNELIEIDLTAHTDCRGSEEYNQDLSLKRAISAKNYLVTNGIAANRIMTYGKGESTPRISCSGGCESCTEEEHQINRRTEIFIRKMDKATNVNLIDNYPEVIDGAR